MHLKNKYVRLQQLYQLHEQLDGVVILPVMSLECQSQAPPNSQLQIGGLTMQSTLKKKMKAKKKNLTPTAEAATSNLPSIPTILLI